VRRSAWLAAVAAISIAACGNGAAAPAPSRAQSPAPVTASPLPTALTPPSGAAPSADAVTFELVATHGANDIPGFQNAGYITLGPDGNLYVPSGSEILVLDTEARIVRRWGSAGTGLGELDFNRDPSDPSDLIGGVAFGPDGSVYVVEAGNKRVQRFSAAGEPELTWGEPGTGDGQFVDPIGIAVSADGEVFVVDDRRDDIQVFTRDGVHLRTIGRQGSGPGELLETGNVRIGPDGQLVNADFGNDRVQAWDAQGDIAWTFGSHGTAPGQFEEVQDVAFGADGTLLVVDQTRVQAFDGDRRVIGTWPDRPNPEHLASIAFDGTTLWVLAPYANAIYQIRVTPGT
jgi:DNA-binding beta-propeller fold protein YncE